MVRPTLAALIFLTVIPGPAFAQEPAGFVISVEGNVTVARAATTAPAALKFKDAVFLGDRITTGERSLVKIFLVSKALLTAGGSTDLTITTEMMNKSTIVLDKGKIAVLRTKMQPGEVNEIRAPNAVVQVRGSVVVVDVQARTTDVDCVAGDIFVAATGNLFVQCPPDQGFTITGNALSPLRPVRPNVMSGLRAKAPGRALGAVPSLPGAPSGPLTVVLPDGRRFTAADWKRDWTLLIDRGSWFEPWVGTATDGYVAGDFSYENVARTTCEAVAKTLAEKGAPMACARAPIGTVRYRNDQGRLMAEGPAAGALVMYEPGSEAGDWRLESCSVGRGRVRVLGTPPPYRVSESGTLSLAACEAAAMSLLKRNELAVACLRPPQEYPELRDAQGRLMAKGPFAAALVIYDWDALQFVPDP